jgi:site-specific recombinase XerD
MKRKAEGRGVPLHPEARAAISVWLDVLARQLKLPQAKDLDPACPVFCSRVREDNGTRRAVARETAWRILEEAVAANELTGKIGTHSMRKTFASRMYDTLGNDLVKVQHATGHTNINATVSYLSFREEDVVNATLAARKEADGRAVFHAKRGGCSPPGDRKNPSHVDCPKKIASGACGAFLAH